MDYKNKKELFFAYVGFTAWIIFMFIVGIPKLIIDKMKSLKK